MIRERALWGCILIGGKSSRMGQPKHLLKNKQGITWLENSVEVLSEVVDQVVLSGSGLVPNSLEHLPRVYDIPGCKGPLAGILSTMRWNPNVSWIISGCDLPQVTKKSLEWLLNQREENMWGVVPIHPKTNRFEPLLACYEAECRSLFERLYIEKTFKITAICEDSKISTPLIPDDLSFCWKNCNFPEDIKGMME